MNTKLSTRSVTLTAFGLPALFVILTASVSLPQTAFSDVVAHYRFEGDGVDATGNGHNGAFNGSISTVTGVFGDAVFFNNTWMELTSMPALGGTDPSVKNFSAAFWFKKPTVTTSSQNLGILGDFVSPTSKAWLMLMRDNFMSDPDVGEVTSLVFDPSSGASASTTTRLDDDVWHHLAIIRDADNSLFTFYVDGVVVNSISNMTGDIRSGQGIFVGRHFDRRHQFNMDELWVFDRALAETEVLSLRATNMVPEPAATVFSIMAAGLFAARRPRRKRP